MASQARNRVVREGEIATYHTFTRTAHQRRLLGKDPDTGVDCSFVLDRSVALLGYFARVFTIDIGNYNFLENHIHLITRTRPDRTLLLSDEEIAWRWRLAWPAYDAQFDQWFRNPTDAEVEEILHDPARLQLARQGLASISWLMARLKQCMSTQINLAHGKSGTCWAGRFGVRELMDDAAVMTCMAYVDSNRIKAGLADSLLESTYSGIRDRIVAHRVSEARKSHQELEHLGIGLSVAELTQLYLNCSWLAPVAAEGPLKLINDAWQRHHHPDQPPEELPRLPADSAPPAPTLPLQILLPDHEPADHESAGEAPAKRSEPDGQPAPDDAARDEKMQDAGPAAAAPQPELHGENEPGSEQDTNCPVRMSPPPAVGAALAEWLIAATPLLGNQFAPSAPASTPKGEISGADGDAPCAGNTTAAAVSQPSAGAAPRDPAPAADLGGRAPCGSAPPAPSAPAGDTAPQTAAGGGAESGSSPDPRQSSRLESPVEAPVDSPVEPHAVSPPGAEPGLQDESAQSQPASSSEPKRTPRTRRVPRPRQQRRPATYEIHNRLMPQLPMRCSDSPILAMPIEQYLVLVLAAVERFLWERRRERGEDLPPCDLTTPAIALLTQLGLYPEAWVDHVFHFEERFHQIVGAPDKVEARQQQAGRQRTWGIQACRSMYLAVESPDTPLSAAAPPDTPIPGSWLPASPLPDTPRATATAMIPWPDTSTPPDTPPASAPAAVPRPEASLPPDTPLPGSPL
jgi:hypothetical protein